MRPDAEFEMVHYLIQLGLNDCQIARASGIPRSTIRRWRVRPDDAMRLKRQTHRCPRCGSRKLDHPAYAYLLGLYLGDGCLVECHRGVFRLEIALDRRYPRVIDECAAAIDTVRSDEPARVSRAVKVGHLVVYNYWKHWPCLFPQHGPGPKHLRTIELESWQREIANAHPGRLLRGLIHSDGSRHINRIHRIWGNGRSKWYAYPRYEFSNASEDIRKIFRDACDAFGVSWRPMNRRNDSVARRADVAKLDLVVGPKC